MKKSKKIIKYCIISIVLMIFIVLAILWIVLFNASKHLSSSITKGEDYSGKAVKYNGKIYKYNKNLINILCLGIDKSKTLAEEHDRGGVGQSDAIFLLSIDTNTKKVNVITIPRDSMVPVKRYTNDGSYYDTLDLQLTLQYSYGDGQKKSCLMTTEAVSDMLYKIPIHRYAAIDLHAITILNDAVGGVPVKIEEDFSWFANNFTIGKDMVLYGEDARLYVQVRNTDVFASSMGRLVRQKKYITSFLKTAKTALKKNIMLPYHVVKELKPYMETNLKPSEAVYLLCRASVDLSNETFTTVPGQVVKGEEHEEYHIDDEGLYQMIIDKFYLEE